MTNLEEAAPFQHRGATYYELNEYIYDADGKLIGLISSRGARYLWIAMRSDQSEFARGQGRWDDWNVDGAIDPGMDAILDAHSAREDALDGRR